MKPILRLRGGRRSAARPDRCGAVIVELALVLPLIVFLVLATIDATTMVFLNHSLTIAAYEGTRVAIKPTGTDDDAIAQAEAFLASRSVAGTTFSVSRIGAAAGERPSSSLRSRRRSCS